MTPIASGAGKRAATEERGSTGGGKEENEIQGKEESVIEIVGSETPQKGGHFADWIYFSMMTTINYIV